MDEVITKAKVLLEALPYIQRFKGSRVVIKYGGNAMVEPELRASFCRDLVLLKAIGLEPILVHGGGPQIGKRLEKAGKKSHFVHGMRVTDHETMEIVEEVLVGEVNADIVADIRAKGGKAIGMSGKDAGLIIARKHRMTRADKDGDLIDLGLVGEVEQIQPEILDGLSGTDYIPVIAPIGRDHHGNTYNINADFAASELAQGLHAAKLMLLTNVAGIENGKGEVQTVISARQAKDQLRRGIIKEGMVPKVRCALDALANGVKQVHIIDGRVSHSLLLEIFTRKGVGTEVKLKPVKARH